MLSSLLFHADEDSQTAALARDGGRAFVSQALRPYLIAALLEREPGKPAIVVAGDDRAARDLAAGLRAWLEPRPVRYYPSRGVSYESHLVPPPHLVGLRIAALDALVDEPGERGAPVVVVSAVALSEKVPDPALRPHGFTLRQGDLLDLEETARELVAAGYERVDQVDDRGQFAIRGGLLDLFPATEDRAVRVDLFGDEIERLSWFATTASLRGGSTSSRRPGTTRLPSAAGSSPSGAARSSGCGTRKDARSRYRMTARLPSGPVNTTVTRALSRRRRTAGRFGLTGQHVPSRLSMRSAVQATRCSSHSISVPMCTRSSGNPPWHSAGPMRPDQPHRGRRGSSYRRNCAGACTGVRRTRSLAGTPAVSAAGLPPSPFSAADWPRPASR